VRHGTGRPGAAAITARRTCPRSAGDQSGIAPAKEKQNPDQRQDSEPVLQIDETVERPPLKKCRLVEYAGDGEPQNAKVADASASATIRRIIWRGGGSPICYAECSVICLLG
jgi:hypothetical protein